MSEGEFGEDGPQPFAKLTDGGIASERERRAWAGFLETTEVIHQHHTIMDPGRGDGANLVENGCVHFPLRRRSTGKMSIKPEENLFARAGGKNPGEQFRRVTAVQMHVRLTGETFQRIRVQLGAQLEAVDGLKNPRGHRRGVAAEGARLNEGRQAKAVAQRAQEGGLESGLLRFDQLQVQAIIAHK